MTRRAFTHRLFGFVLLISGIVGSGCSSMNEISKTRDVIALETDSRFDRGMQINLSPGLFRTAGWLTRYVDDVDAQWAGNALYGVRRVRAGVYPSVKVRNLYDFDVYKLPQFSQKGWKLAYEYVTDDEMHWLLYRERRDVVKEMFVVALDDDVLVLARIQGQLNGLLDVSVEAIEQEFERLSFSDDEEDGAP